MKKIIASLRVALTRRGNKRLFLRKDMKTLLITFILAATIMVANAKPHCQGFNNYDDRVTIVFTDDKARSNYSVSDVKLFPYCLGPLKGKKYEATSVSVSVNKGVATVTLTFNHMTQFCNPKVELRINGKKTSFKVCQ